MQHNPIMVEVGRWSRNKVTKDRRSSRRGVAAAERRRAAKRMVNLLMDLDNELCLCFHVTCRKVVNFLRVERPQRVGQLADCFGAGTGCGWCRPFLQKLFDAAKASGEIDVEVPDAETYALMRRRYLRQRKEEGNR